MSDGLVDLLFGLHIFFLGRSVCRNGKHEYASEENGMPCAEDGTDVTGVPVHVPY